MWRHWAYKVVSKLHLVGFWRKVVLLWQCPLFHVSFPYGSLGQRVKRLYWKSKSTTEFESGFDVWLVPTGNEVKLRRRECTYWFATPFFFLFVLCLFVCLLPFLLGWVPSNSTYLPWSDLYSWPDETESVLWHFLTPFLNLKAPGLEIS